MKIKPVIKCKDPEYPDYKIYTKHPEQLAKYLPESWKGKKIVLSTFLAFILSGNVQSTHSGEQVKPGNIILNADANSTDSITNILPENIAPERHSVYTAPVFSFGDGRGVLGCVVENQPIFISEGEAQQIILEEFEKSGITFDVKNKQIEGISFDKYTTKKKEGTNKYETVKDGVVDVSFDGYNSKLNLGFQFISRDDWEKFGEDSGLYFVWAVDTKEVAKKLQVKLLNQDKFNSVIFYDPQPVIDFHAYMRDAAKSRKNGNPITKYEDLCKEANEEAREMLRSQIHTFIEWLKKENKFPLSPVEKVG